MEEAFEIYISTPEKIFKVKMLKLKILGALIHSKYDEKEYDKAVNTPQKSKVTFDELKDFLERVNGTNGNKLEVLSGIENFINTIRLLNIINSIVANFDETTKNKFEIKYLPPNNKPTDVNIAYIYILKLYISLFNDALTSLNPKYTTSGIGIESFVSFKLYEGLEETYRFSIVRDYIKVVRIYDEMMLIYMRDKNKDDPILKELLILRNKLDIEVKNEYITNINFFVSRKKIIELLKEYNRQVEEYYDNIKSPSSAGGAPVKYKYVPTGDVAYILYNKKRIKRNIYVKVKGRPTKYCKINKEYVLLSKLR